MVRIINGYTVEIDRAVLYSGTWEDGDWDWEAEYYDFFTEEEAEKFFKKQKKVTKEDDVIVRMMYCDFEVNGNNHILSSDLGDEIKEYFKENDGSISVWKM